MRWLLWCFCLLAESYETINHYHCLYVLTKQNAWNLFFYRCKKICEDNKKVPCFVPNTFQTKLRCFLKVLQTMPALPLCELSGCLGLWVKGDAKKYNCVVQKVMNVHQNREWTWLKSMKHTSTQFERIKAFQVCCRMVKYFSYEFQFTYTRQAISQFGIKFSHVILF